MVGYGLADGETDLFVSPRASPSSLLGRRVPGGRSAGVADASSPRTRHSPESEPVSRPDDDVLRMVKLVALDSASEFDARNSLLDARAFMSLKANELDTYNMLSRGEQPRPAVPVGETSSPGQLERNRKRKAAECQRRNQEMLHSVESAINTTALAIAAELNRQAAEARMKAAAAEAQRKAELDAEASRKEAEQAAKAATEEAEKRAAEAERAAAEELRKAAEAEAKRKEAEEALVKAEADNQRKREEALRSQAAAEKASAVAPVAPGVDPNASQKKGGSGEAQAAVQSIPGNRTTPAALEQAGRYMQLLKDIKANVRPAVKADRQLNQFCFKSRMTVTLRIGQITNSRTQVRRISNDLITLLADAGRVSPLARQWVMDFLAKQMANQAEKEVAVFKPLAFPMARVAQNVVAKSPEFCEILLGRLMKRNPYLIPNYPIRLKSESLDEYCKRLAMKKRDDEWEKEAHYEERLGGTAALFAAFMQTLPEGAPGGCLTMADAWTWLARLLNLPPRKITPQLILTFLEVAGPELLRTYRKQATKLLRFIAEKCLPQMPKESVAATTRLRLHLEGTRNKVHLPEPDGFRFSEP